LRRGLGPLLLAASLGALAEDASAQTFTPNTLLVSPLTGRFLAESEVSWARAEAFVADQGERNSFPGTLDFGFAVLRVSYSPIQHFSAGLELALRTFRFRPDGFGEPATGTGVQGLGVFADWHPSGPDARVSFEARGEVFFGFDGHPNPLSISDGVNRYLAAFQVFSGPDGGVLEGWRLDAQTRLEFEFGPNTEPEDHYAEWDLLVHAGPRITRLGSAQLLVLAITGCRFATNDRQEGNIFRVNPSKGVTVGGSVGLYWASPMPGPGRAIEAAATREIGLRNSLDGWKGTMTFRHAF